VVSGGFGWFILFDTFRGKVLLGCHPNTQVRKVSYKRPRQLKPLVDSTVELETANGSNVCIHLQGGHITSFNDVLFMSSKAIFKEGKAIRGGIPICWPQFGPGTIVQHGFARTTRFEVKSKQQDADRGMEEVS